MSCLENLCHVLLFFSSCPVVLKSSVFWTDKGSKIKHGYNIDLNIIGWRLIMYEHVGYTSNWKILISKVTAFPYRMNHRKTHPHPNFDKLLSIECLVSQFPHENIDIDIFMWNWLWTQDQDSSDIQVPFRFHFARKALLQSDDHWKCLRWPHMTSTERVQPWCA